MKEALRMQDLEHNQLRVQIPESKMITFKAEFGGSGLSSKNWPVT